MKGGAQSARIQFKGSRLLFDLEALSMLSEILARACGIPVGWRSGGRLATTLVATINVIIFFFFFLFFFSFLFSVVYFSHRRSAWIKKLIQQKLTGAPKNLGIHAFADPLSHFGPPGSHVGFLRFL